MLKDTYVIYSTLSTCFAKFLTYLKNTKRRGYASVMKLLIDTNVILDLVLNCTNAAASASLFRKMSIAKDSAYITASSVTDLFYIIRKETHNINLSYSIMEKILKMVSVITVTESDICTALMLK